MPNSQITDEMVERAAEALCLTRYPGAIWRKQPNNTKDMFRTHARAALSAALPEQSSEPCLSPTEQKAQGARCGCMGANDYCGCQNVPDATTRQERAVLANKEG